MSKLVYGGNWSLPLGCLHLIQHRLVASHRPDPRPPTDRGVLPPDGGPPGPTWDLPHAGLELWYPPPLSPHGGHRRGRAGVPGAATPGHPPARRGGGSELLVSRRLCGSALLLDSRPRLLVSRGQTKCLCLLPFGSGEILRVRGLDDPRCRHCVVLALQRSVSWFSCTLPRFLSSCRLFGCASVSQAVPLKRRRWWVPRR